MRRWLFLLLMLSNLAFIAARPLANQPSVNISGADVKYIYGDKATFQAHIASDPPFQKMYLFIKPEGQTARVQEVKLNTLGDLSYEYDLKKNPLRPFADTLYWFRFTFTNKEEVTSDVYSFAYIDNRVSWENMTDGTFEVRWYGRGIDFGLNALNAAQKGLESARAVLPIDQELKSPVKIYVYANPADFQNALQLSGQSWVAGHASPELNTIIVSIPPGPGEKQELERQLPHEVTHILEYMLTGDAYDRIPNWLLEGTASMAELRPNPDYQSVLTNASDTNTLIPIDQLCGLFPRDASGAFLAYAEVTSFTRYLHKNYGTTGVKSLFQQYEDGVGCQEGPTRAFNVSLNEMDYRWRQEELHVNMEGLLLNRLSPYLAILGVLVVIPLVVVLPMVFSKKHEG